jgi:hypothetical protein
MIIQKWFMYGRKQDDIIYIKLIKLITYILYVIKNV